MAIPLKYQAKEVLNKVLNAGEDALNVDLADSVSVTVDSEFPDAAAITDNFANPTTTSAMSMLMGYDGSAWDRVTIGGGTEATALRVTIASDSTGVLSIDDNGGNISIDDGGNTITVDGTVSVSGLLADGHNVTIDNSSGGSAVNIQDGGNTITVDGTVDLGSTATTHLSEIEGAVETIETTVGTDGSAGPAKTLSVGGTESGGNIQELRVDSDGHLQVDALSSALPSGAATAANQLAAGHTIDCNSTFIKLKDGSGTSVTSNSGKLDVCLHSEDGTAINETANALDVNIASGGFGGVVTNGGTFAVQVDGSALTALQLIDDTVATLGTTTYTEETTKGNVVGAVRNDTLATLADTDNEIAPLQVNKSGALYTVEETGQLGAIYESGTTAVSGEQIIAIQFLEDTKFTTLTPASAAFIGTASGDGDNIVNTEVFPQGMTIFGRWTAFTLVTGGRVIAYKGVW